MWWFGHGPEPSYRVVYGLRGKESRKNLVHPQKSIFLEVPCLGATWKEGPHAHTHCYCDPSILQVLALRHPPFTERRSRHKFICNHYKQLSALASIDNPRDSKHSSPRPQTEQLHPHINYMLTGSNERLCCFFTHVVARLLNPVKSSDHTGSSWLSRKGSAPLPCLLLSYAVYGSVRRFVFGDRSVVPL